jgi:hypothetical protein
MLIQKLDDYELNVGLTWLSQQELHLKITTSMVDGTTSTASTHNRSYFITPEEAMRLADYLNDVLCR